MRGRARHAQRSGIDGERGERALFPVVTDNEGVKPSTQWESRGDGDMVKRSIRVIRDALSVQPINFEAALSAGAEHDTLRGIRRMEPDGRTVRL
jgi:hypothetical protein